MLRFKDIQSALLSGECIELYEEDGGNSSPKSKNIISARLLHRLLAKKEGSNFAHPKGLHIDGAVIIGNLELEGCHADFPIRLTRCNIRGRINLRRGRIKLLDLSGSNITSGIAARGLIVDNDLLFAGSMSCCGRIDLSHSKISGAVRFRGARLEGGVFIDRVHNSDIERISLDLSFCDIGGSLIFDNVDITKGEVNLFKAKIYGNLSFFNSKICYYPEPNDLLKKIRRGRYAIHAELSSVGGNLVFAKTEVIGECRFVGVSVSGNFYCRLSEFFNCYIANSADDRFLFPVSLNCERMVVKGYLTLRKSNIKGRIRLHHASVGANLAIIFSSIADISPEDVNASEGLLDDDRIMIGANLIGVGGNVILSGGVFNGNSSFSFCRVSESFIVENMELSSNSLCAFDLRLANITGALSFRKVNINGLGRFNYTKAGSLMCDQYTVDNWRGEAWFDGLEYKSIARTDSSRSVDWLGWLEKMGKFRVQPYEQLARALRADGQLKVAKNILIAKEKANPRSSKAERALYEVYGWIVGYGYNPWRAIGAAIILQIGCAAFYEYAYNKDAMVSSRAECGATSSTTLGAQSIGGMSSVVGADKLVKNLACPAFSPAFYSVDVFLPVGDLRQKNYWVPTDSSPIGSIAWVIVRFEALLGWVLTTLLLVAWTGLIKKE